MIRFRFLLALLPLVGFAPNAAAEPPAGGDWVSTFADEFDGTVLDLNVWAAGRPADLEDPDDVDPHGALLSDGALHLVTRHREHGDGEWTTTWLSPRPFRQTYGYVEVRMRFARATGLNDLVALVSDSGLRQGGPAICVVDGSYPSQVKVKLKRPGRRSEIGVIVDKDIDLSAEFHVYGLSWLPNGKGQIHLTWYMDGAPIHQADCPECTKPMHLLIGTRVTTWNGPFAPVPAGASMDVDYVRTYQQRTLVRHPNN
jgi:beta-glucanase (GH16 family)